MNWYLDTKMNIHIDNHSRIVGKGMAIGEIERKISDTKAETLQISAYGAVGNRVTYPSRALPYLNYPDDEAFDTVGLFEKVARSLGIRFFIYINTRGFLLDKDHIDWIQRDAAGAGSNFRDGNDMCCRAAADGSGYLETILLPLLCELTEVYQPDGFWVDGDHAKSETCYCPNCVKAWQPVQNEKPPQNPADPGWSHWYQINATRRDEYRRMMARAVHAIKADTLYCSNHSYWNVYTPSRRNIDPRLPESWVGYTSADLSHGDAITQTRLSAMQLSSLAGTGHDIMHLVGERISQRRFLQQGALTVSSGSPWFVWASSSFVDQPDIQERVEYCTAFIRDRESVLGRSTSANPVAVLVSESEWEAARVNQKPFTRIRQAIVTALSLQDYGFPVDIITPIPDVLCTLHNVYNQPLN